MSPVSAKNLENNSVRTQKPTNKLPISHLQNFLAISTKPLKEHEKRVAILNEIIARMQKITSILTG